MSTDTLFGQPVTGMPGTSGDADAYTLAVQFSVSTACTASAIWFWSPSGAAAIPTTIAIWTVSTTTVLHSESASWSGAAGSGWIRAAFSSAPSLSSGTAYKASVLQPSSVDWYPSVANWWSSGPGASGITGAGGIVSAPNNAGADVGQCSYFFGSSTAYPNNTFNAAQYYVDIEVTTPGGLVVPARQPLVVPSLAAIQAACW